MATKKTLFFKTIANALETMKGSELEKWLADNAAGITRGAFDDAVRYVKGGGHSIPAAASKFGKELAERAPAGGRGKKPVVIGDKTPRKVQNTKGKLSLTVSIQPYGWTNALVEYGKDRVVITKN